MTSSRRCGAATTDTRWWCAAASTASSGPAPATSRRQAAQQAANGVAADTQHRGRARSGKQCGTSIEWPAAPATAPARGGRGCYGWCRSGSAPGGSPWRRRRGRQTASLRPRAPGPVANEGGGNGWGGRSATQQRQQWQCWGRQTGLHALALQGLQVASAFAVQVRQCAKWAARAR